jgi:hypothetical protein
MQVNLKASLLLVTAVFVAPVFASAGIDLHRLWDDRCIDCHGHAGEFARRSLSVVGGELQGRHHLHDLRRFLHNHYLADSEVDAVYDMLLAQAGSEARFKGECSRCHKRAAEFVRNSLRFRNGVLYGLKSGEPVSIYLGHHQQLRPDDAAFFAEVLTRVAGEVYRP